MKNKKPTHFDKDIPAVYLTKRQRKLINSIEFKTEKDAEYFIDKMAKQIAWECNIHKGDDDE